MTRPIIQISGGICKMPRWRMRKPVDFTLFDDEHMAIVGRNGSGKSMLVDILTGRHPLLADQIAYDFSDCNSPLASDNIRYIAFRDTYGGDNDRTYFLQQRWNQMEIDAETPTAGEKLEEAFLLAGSDSPERRRQQQRLYDRFGMQQLLDKKMILLSSGELRKLKLLSALFATPRVLIIDNPFIGLDSDTRNNLAQLLEEIAHASGNPQEAYATKCQVILVLSRPEEIPQFVGTVVEVDNMTVGERQKRDTYIYNNVAPSEPILPDYKRQQITKLPTHASTADSKEVVRMTDVSIRYGNRTILSSLNWVVGKGERWALSGQNGAGKSTLLSLICADNPQAYACDIALFGRSRGSGETIWQIKKHIGYVSPEMHRSYNRPIPTVKVVASGLTDSVGLYVRTTDDDRQKCLFWMDIFGIKDKADTLFTELSSGEQRLALLARAFVKDPELLILDEPLHGLDNFNRQLAKDVITTFCQRPDKTLIMVTHYEEELPPIITNRLHLLRHE